MPSDPLPPPDLVALVPAAAALLLRSLVLAGETATVALGAERVEELADSWAKRALLKLKANPETSAAGVRTSQSLLLACAVALVAVVCAHTSRAFWPAFPETAAAVCGAAVVWAVTVALDAIPRSVAGARPKSWALAVAPLILLLRWLVLPVTRTVSTLGDLMLAPLGARVRFTPPPLPLEELERMLTLNHEAGAPEPALVRSLFEFPDITAKEIMVPRTDVVAVPIDADPRQVVQTLVEESHTRVPVYEGGADTIVGLLHVKDVLPLLADPRPIVLRELLRPVTFVPWNRPVPEMMREMQRAGQHLAVVVDEYGGMAGIVTLEDIVEQIVGEIRDEFDEEESELVQAADGSALVRGEMRVDDFNEALGADIPEEAGYETLGGFLSSLAGAIPAEGDCFFHEGFEFRVMRRDPRRVLEVRVHRIKAPAEPSSG